MDMVLLKNHVTTSKLMAQPFVPGKNVFVSNMRHSLAVLAVF
jgi:hypothetical protein